MRQKAFLKQSLSHFIIFLLMRKKLRWMSVQNSFERYKKQRIFVLFLKMWHSEPVLLTLKLRDNIFVCWQNT
jgi:hypothetical protein